MPCNSPNNIIITLDMNTYTKTKLDNIMNGATFKDPAMFPVGMVRLINMWQRATSFLIDDFQDLYLIGGVWIADKEVSIKYDSNKNEWTKMAFDLPHSSSWRPRGTLVPSSGFFAGC